MGRKQPVEVFPDGVETVVVPGNRFVSSVEVIQDPDGYDVVVINPPTRPVESPKTLGVFTVQR